MWFKCVTDGDMWHMNKIQNAGVRGPGRSDRDKPAIGRAIGGQTRGPDGRRRSLRGGWGALLCVAACSSVHGPAAAGKIDDRGVAGGPPTVQATATDATAGGSDGFVDVLRLEPTLRVDLRYATTDNFTGRAVYPPSARCYLRAAVAARLVAVQRALTAQGLGLKLWDCYRPLGVQRTFFALVPDERYVANPAKGSRHNRGAAVDLTMVDAAGRELAMPTAFDDFSERAHRTYMALPAEALANRARLEQAMTQAGFVPMPTEWWHFDDRDAGRYPISDVSFDALQGRR